jgi:uncharacterized membrane protein
MKPKTFLQQLDEDRVLAAIANAESKTSGEIRLFVSHRRVEDALGAAREQFTKLGMTQTRQRNGVLIFVAPESQTFAIVGDSGVHEKCGEAFWDQVSDSMGEQLKQGHWSAAILLAVERVADLLARHFPREPGDQNELPDEIARD